MMLMVIVAVLSGLVAGSLEYLIALIRYLQIVLHLPLMKVALPANIIFMNRVLIAFAMFDLFDSGYTTDPIY